MQATINRWGNSLALRLPRHVAEQVRLAEGTTVDLEIEDGTLRVTPSRKRFKLADLLQGLPPREETREPQEFDWGGSEGDEAW
jgi:antitoxin MazE